MAAGRISDASVRGIDLLPPTFSVSKTEDLEVPDGAAVMTEGAPEVVEDVIGAILSLGMEPLLVDRDVPFVDESRP